MLGAISRYRTWGGGFSDLLVLQSLDLCLSPCFPLVFCSAPSVRPWVLGRDVTRIVHAAAHLSLGRGIPRPSLTVDRRARRCGRGDVRVGSGDAEPVPAVRWQEVQVCWKPHSGAGVGSQLCVTDPWVWLASSWGWGYSLSSGRTIWKKVWERNRRMLEWTKFLSFPSSLSLYVSFLSNFEDTEPSCLVLVQAFFNYFS